MRVDVMRAALLAKFEQHADLRARLAATGAAHLTEAAPNDYFWGEGSRRTGTNMLDRLLVEIRDSLTA